MSELPELDARRVAERIITKKDERIAQLQKDLEEAASREAQLEILAEALRDQRDALQEKLESLSSDDAVEGVIVDSK